jgi:hypothetical protein
MIRNTVRWGFLACCAVFLFAADAAGQATSTDVTSVPRPVDIQQVLSWLPTDTETVIAANEAFSLPDWRNVDWNREFHTEAWLRAITVLSPLRLKNGSLLEYFKNQRVAFALEGSRHFRVPKGLGLFPFEGCTIVVLADDVGDRADLYFKSSSGALRVEEAEGQKILVFEETEESGLWTTFIAFKKPNVLLVATNLDYLREVISRMRDNSGPRALPETLPEWSYVNTDA